ncbi:hypothetical protein PENTCL1PPCAC_21127, partial [Pristionchus entomophagus]
DNWWIFHDEKRLESTVVGRNLSIVCMRKLCNKCVELGGSGTFRTNEKDAADCVMMTCTDQLWNVKRTGATSFEQYSGEVECSSERATEGR